MPMSTKKYLNAGGKVSLLVEKDLRNNIPVGTCKTTTKKFVLEVAVLKIQGILKCKEIC